MEITFDKTKSLQELATSAGTGSAKLAYPKTIDLLRHKPVAELSVDELRTLISQHVGLEFLVPIAIEILEEKPAATGDFYPGDLLKAVLEVPPVFWQDCTVLRFKINDIITDIESLHDILSEEIVPAIELFREHVWFGSE